MKEEREKHLPKWAQRKLEQMRVRIAALERMREAHDVLSSREWFTIYGPGMNAGDTKLDTLKLFTLTKDGAHCITSLHHKDVLLVGRHLDRHPSAKVAL